MKISRSIGCAFLQVLMVIVCTIALLGLIIYVWGKILGLNEIGMVIIASMGTWVMVSSMIHEIITRKEIRRFMQFVSMVPDAKLETHALYGYVAASGGVIFGFKKGFVCVPSNPRKIFKTRDERVFKRIERFLSQTS